ncbi:MAG: DUF420 domain-containing protein [Candidatus Aminicenantes bacterium]|nr:DUF420 domain-containing protein [Candidatus Aminicenantes bacterium]
MNISDLPALNAGLNALSGSLLGVGYAMIRRGRVKAHKAFMLAAVGVSTLFLVSYVVYHYHAGSTRFPGTGWVRTLYLSILVTHAVLAAAVIPLAAVTLVRAWREDFPAHRRIARWTLPIWFYVSVTGVIIYVMLYHLYAR